MQALYCEVVAQSFQPASKTRNNQQSSSVFNPQIGDEEPDTVSNDQPQGIVYDDEMLPDSVLRSRIFTFSETVRAVKIHRLQNPSLSPTGSQSNDPLTSVEMPFFTSLGALGQVHKPLFYSSSDSYLSHHEIHCPDPLPFYRQSYHRSRFFQAQMPFTMLGYGSSLDKDYQIHVIHTQNIRPRWNMAMLYDLISRDGLYTNSGVTSHLLDITTNYYSKDARYQLQAAFAFNRIRQEENGGVVNDITCWDYSRESGVPVNMYSAYNQWRDIALHIHQSFNTVRQFDMVREHEREITDSINDSTIVTDTTTAGRKEPKTETIYDTVTAPKPSTFNTGVFALDLTYARHRRIFADNQASSWFYNYGTLDSTFIYDSTAHHHIAAELYWTNDAYMQHHWSNPVTITGGVRPQYDEVRFAKPGAKMSELSISPFASAQLHLGRFDLKANAEETNGTHRLGDYRLEGSLGLQFKNNSDIEFSLLSEAHSPSMLYYHNEGVYNWDIDDYNKIKQQRVVAQYNYRSNPYDSNHHSRIRIPSSHLSVASTLISDNVWFDSQMTPTQGDATALLLQADMSGHLQIGWFNLRTHQMLQHSSNDAVVRVPLFASKNSLFADFKLFRGALQTQIGVDLRYHTKYYCDGWNPVLGTFYRQDDVKVGNYLVGDLWLTLQVKRTTIYLRASHLNALIEDLAGLQPSYFNLPHYPYENFTIYWGLIVRFFD